MRDVKQLHPRLQKLVDELKTACERKGLRISITECLRTVEEQNALYAQGRTKPGKIVTKANGSSYSSMHQWGIAFDFCRNDGRSAFDNSDGFFDKVGEIGRVLGLEWGGSWKTIKDKPHFQLPDWGSTPTRLKQTYGTPTNFMKTWQAVEVKPADPNEKYGKLLDRKKFETLKSTYLRKTPGGDKIEFRFLDEVTQAKCTKDLNGYARIKIGKKFERIRKYTGSKGNTWYQMVRGYWLMAKKGKEKLVKEVK